MQTMLDPSTIQIAGGLLLLTDMILTAVLFAFWEKAGQVQVRIRKR